MERTIYLVRHGAVFRSDEERRCIGWTDPPLTDEGRREAEKLGGWFAGKKLGGLWSSPLRRCTETAECIAEKTGLAMKVHADLRELCAGKWENLSFSVIRAAYPEEYSQRGADLWRNPIPGGESFEEAGQRFAGCLTSILTQTTGDLVIVAHGGVIRSCIFLLWQKAGDVREAVFTESGNVRKMCKEEGCGFLQIPQPCGGISILVENDGVLSLRAAGYKPEEFLDEAAIKAMYRYFQTPEPVIRHMQAAADFMDRLSVLPGWDPAWNRDRLRKAALVHDIARTFPEHAKRGADFLLKEGYPGIAEMVRGHHSPIFCETAASARESGQNTGGGLSEADILFYADKRVQGEREVSLAERFAKSLEKCVTEKAIRKHRSLFERAKMIEEKLYGQLI